jgi:hypothetical protein
MRRLVEEQVYLVFVPFSYPIGPGLRGLLWQFAYSISDFLGKKREQASLLPLSLPRTGFEPARLAAQALNLLRMPIPPPGLARYYTLPT